MSENLEKYRRHLLAFSPQFGKHTLVEFCMCWTYDDKTGVLRVTPKSGISVQDLKDLIVPVGYLIERLPESECAFAKLKR